MTGMREDQSAVSLTVNGVNYGIFDTKDGGDVKAKEVKHKSGNMGQEVSLGGPKSVDTIKLSRMSLLDDPPRVKALMALVGKGRCVVTDQGLDANGARFSDPLTYTGVLIGVHPPKADSNGTAVKKLELEVSPDENVA